MAATSIDDSLLDSELLMRVDPVAAIGFQTFRFGRGIGCFSMGITDRRLIFTRPARGNYLRLLLMEQWKGNGYIANLGCRAVPLAGIKRLWKWQPEFSGMPMAQFDDGSTFSFQLLAGEYPRFETAPIDKRREHFEAVEAAWEAARQRAASAPDHPENRQLKTENRS